LFHLQQVSTVLMTRIQGFNRMHDKLK